MSVSVSTKSSGPSWLKSGADSKAAFATAQFQQEQMKADADKMRRFFLKVGEERQITFLDGDLDKDGVLSFLSFNEHTIQVGQKWDNFTCVAESEPCPICARGDRAAYVGVLTVIDHTPYTIQQGPNAGNIIKDQRKLFIAKLTTLRALQHYAAKRGGLRGWKVESTRMSDKDARVGSGFQFLERRSPSDLITSYGENGVAADYEKEIRYLDAKALIAAGVGKAPTGPGYEKPVSDHNGAIDQM